MYRATRLINWCPECRTALSDLEVENEEGANGELFEFAYKVEGGDREIVVATTRPETMLGDTAVAVHPDDPRYTRLHGKKLVHPFVDRHVPDHHRRHPRRPEVRHRRREGHARARLQRLRDRQAPRARGDQHPQPRRHAQRQRRPVRRASTASSARTRREEGARREGPRAREQAAHAHAPALPALGRRRRADDLDAVVPRR